MVISLSFVVLILMMSGSFSSLSLLDTGVLLMFTLFVVFVFDSQSWRV